MTKHRIGYDELWPVFGLDNANDMHDPDDKFIELSPEELADYAEANRRWSKWQARLYEAYGWDDAH